MPSQLAIRQWFNRTYRTKGLDYLRPAEFYAIFLDYLGAAPGDRLLDVGCGPGLLLGEAVKRGVEAHGVDLSESAIAMARRLVPAASAGVCNSQALCYADGVFDYLTCIGVFEHFLDPDGALREMCRVLAPGGRLCVMVPNSRTLKWKIEGEWLRLHDEESHERAAPLEEWREVFERNGLTVEALHRDEWPAWIRRRRLARLVPGRRQGDFVTSARTARHLVPLRYANQFVFILRPPAGD